MQEPKYDLPDPPGGGSFDLPDPDTLKIAQVERKPRAYVKPPKVEPKPKEAETLGFITNLPKSLLNVAKSIFVDLPVAVGTNAYKYAKDPSQYSKDLDLFLSHPGNTGEFLRKEVTDYYTDNFWANFNEDPARFLQDAATVLDGIGLAGKLGTTGKAARIAQTAGKAAEWVDPLRVAGKGAKLAFGKGLRAFGIDEHTPDLQRLAAHIGAKEALEASEATKKALFDKLAPEQKEELLDLLMVGVPEQLEAASKTPGSVSKRLANWNDRIATTEEPFWKAKQALTDDDMIKANAKGVAMRTNTDRWIAKHGLPISAEQAEQMIRDGVLKPTYMSMYRLKNQALDLYDAINSKDLSRGLLGRLEQRLGRGEYLQDVDEIMARQIHSFHQAKYKLNLLDNVKELMAQKGKLLIAHTLEEVESGRKQGYRTLHDAFYKKYWSSYSKATAQQLQGLIDAGKAGLSQSDALAKTREAFLRAESLDTLPFAKDSGEVLVPEAVAAWLNRELAPVSVGWQVFDKWMSRYKSAVTVFNPRYWAPVIFGNSLLGTMYGLSPDMVKLALKFKGDLPPVFKQLMQHEIFLKDLDLPTAWVTKANSRLTKWAGDLDNLFRSGMFAQEITKDAQVRMKFNISNFETAYANIEAALKHYSAAPDRLYATLTQISELRNKAAAALLLKDRKLQQLKRLEARRFRELERLSQHREISYQELSASIDARKDVLAKAFADVSNLNPRYTYFTTAFNTAMNEVRLALNRARKGGQQLDNAGIVQAMDVATHAVAAGHPEWLRHAVRKLRLSLSNKSPLAHKRSRLSVLVDMVGAAEDRLKEHTSDFLLKLSEAGQLSKQVPGLQQEADVAFRAIEVGNRFFGSHYSLLPFERQVIKRIIPFYTFTKAMTSLAFRFPFLYPKRSFMTLHLARAWNDIMADENAFMPSWTRNYVPVAGMEDGSVVMIRAGSLGPMSNVRMNRMGDKPLPGIYDVASQNPVIRLMFEMKGGIPEWSAKPLSPDDHSVRLDNGEVVKWTGTGFQKVIAQPSVFKSIAYLFPQAQLIDQLMNQYAQTDRGWLFNPAPIKSPAGKIRYPKELQDTVMSFLVPTTTIKPAELERRERVAVALVAKEYQREIRSASPERRATLIESLKEWANSRKRAIER